LADGHGGYRKPANPAPVSGPGAHSQRTDGAQPVMTGLGDGSYGDESAMQEIQGGAQMAQAPSGPSAAPSGPHPALGAIQSLTPLDAPSAWPGVPVTDGADAGPGADSAALGGFQNPSTDANNADAKHLQKYLPVFLQVANDDNAPPGFKQWVRNIIANL
jgi:hypothetical protein